MLLLFISKCELSQPKRSSGNTLSRQHFNLNQVHCYQFKILALWCCTTYTPSPGSPPAHWACVWQRRLLWFESLKSERVSGGSLCLLLWITGFVWYLWTPTPPHPQQKEVVRHGGHASDVKFTRHFLSWLGYILPWFEWSQSASPRWVGEGLWVKLVPPFNILGTGRKCNVYLQSL